MRLLIGNDLDDSLVRKRDVRAWTQRLLWFVQEDDIVVLMCQPDPEFARYVFSLTGVDASRVHFLRVLSDRMDPGPLGERMFDPLALLAPDLLAQIARISSEDSIKAVIPLWPSVHVATMAGALGVEESLEGYGFISQNGGDLANSKATFRALAAGAAVPIAAGSVCGTMDDAIDTSRKLLEHRPAIMVKRVHAGAGGGNEVVTLDEELSTGSTGNKYVTRLGNTTEDLEDYWRRRWAWATADGRFSVVIEAYLEVKSSVYAEYYCGTQQLELNEVGELQFEHGGLVREIVPCRSLNEEQVSQLLLHSERLAESYRLIGYRGFLSVDAITGPGGEITLTEVNARFTGSTHLYGPIGRGLAAIDANPERSVTQFVAPAEWGPLTLEGLLRRARAAKLDYSPEGRRGLVIPNPLIAEFGSGHSPLCFVHGPGEFESLYTSLGSALARSEMSY